MIEGTASPGDVVRGRVWGLGIKPGASGKAVCVTAELFFQPSKSPFKTNSAVALFG